MVLNHLGPTGLTRQKKQKEKDTLSVYGDEERGVTIEMTKTSVILNNMINWSKNRPPDEVRVAQIADYYKTLNVRLVPGMVSAWKKKDEDQYIIYDGIHRLLAAAQIDYDVDVFVKVWKTDNETDIMTDFKAINMAISIPFVYLHESHILKKTVCESVAKKMCEMYPMFLSGSRHPQPQNFNRDNLIEFLSSLNINFTRHKVDELIISELQKLNQYAKKYVIINNIKVPNKCDTHNFYLFFLKKTFIANKLEETFLNE